MVASVCERPSPSVKAIDSSAWLIMSLAGVSIARRIASILPGSMLPPPPPPCIHRPRPDPPPSVCILSITFSGSSLKSLFKVHSPVKCAVWPAPEADSCCYAPRRVETADETNTPISDSVKMLKANRAFLMVMNCSPFLVCCCPTGAPAYSEANAKSTNHLQRRCV